MKKILLFLLLISGVGSIHAVERDLVKEMQDNYLQMRQKPNTESMLKEYLSEIDTKNDTIYAIMYGPMNCPRCEAFIRTFAETLKKFGKDNELLMITIYPDEEISTNYNKKNKYIADYYIYDTEMKYEEIFSFNTSGIYNTEIMKIDKRNGRLITGGDVAEMSNDFVKQLIAYKNPMDFYIFGNVEKDDFIAPEPNVSRMKAKYIDYIVNDNSDKRVSTVYDLPKFENGKFYYNDKINNGIMFFNEDYKNKELNLCTLFQSDSVENRQFVSIDEKYYRNFINSGSVFYMALGASMLDKDKIGISYSLPNLFYDESSDTNDIRLGYRNEACMITRNVNTFQKDSLRNFDFEHKKEDFFYAHYTFVPFSDKVIFGCKKYTWPLEFEAWEYKDDVNRNSFADAFYKTENPIMAVFSLKTGELLQRFGHLEDVQKKSLTGYYYVKPIAVTQSEYVLYSNGYTGTIYLSREKDLNKSIREYSAFEIESDEFPAPDSTKFYTYEYVKPYDRFFYRCIEDIKMNDKEIYCMVRYGTPKNTLHPDDSYSLITIDRKTGKRKEILYPKYEGYEVLGHGLKDDNGKISPFIFMKKNRKVIVRVIKQK